MEMIRCYFSKRWLSGPLQSRHHVKTHTHSMGLVSFRRIFLPAHRPVGFQRSFEALALSTLHDSIGNFLLSFFSPRGTWIGISPWSVCLRLIPPHSLCLCSRRAPSRLKLWEEGYSKRVTGQPIILTEGIHICIEKSHEIITVYWLCSCVSMLFLLVPAISQKISAIPFHTLFCWVPLLVCHLLRSRFRGLFRSWSGLLSQWNAWRLQTQGLKPQGRICIRNKWLTCVPQPRSCQAHLARSILGSHPNRGQFPQGKKGESNRKSRIPAFEGGHFFSKPLQIDI